MDPNLQSEQDQAHQNLVSALQSQVEGDSASLMARYGSRLALAGTTGTAGAMAGVAGVPPIQVLPAGMATR